MSDSRHENTAKFMTNLNRKPMDHTRHIGFLKYFTPNPQVPNRRIVAGLVATALTVVVTILLFILLSESLLYVVWGILSFALACLILCVMYMVPIRSESALGAVFSATVSSLVERLRLKSSVNAELKSLGINKLSRDGQVRLDSVHVGYFYEVEGQFSRSTLPSVVKAVNDIRAKHLISRSTFSGEMLITMISRIDLTEQLDYYREIYERNSRGTVTPEMDFRRQLIQMDYNYTKDNIHQKRTDIRQYMLITDIDTLSLNKSASEFEFSANNGMLAYARRMNGKEINSVFKPMGLNNPQEI